MNEPTLPRICFAEVQPLSQSENGMRYTSSQILRSTSMPHPRRRSSQGSIFLLVAFKGINSIPRHECGNMILSYLSSLLLLSRIGSNLRRPAQLQHHMFNYQPASEPCKPFKQTGLNVTGAEPRGQNARFLRRTIELVRARAAAIRPRSGDGAGPLRRARLDVHYRDNFCSLIARNPPLLEET